MPNPFKKPKRPSAPLPEDLDLEAFFTDVEHLRQVFHDLVSAGTLPKRLLIIHGVGGVGKSTLLRMYRLYCKRQGIPVALVSGDEVKSPVDVLHGFAQDLAPGGIKLPHFAKTHEQYRAIQARVEEQARKDTRGKAVDLAGKVAAKTAEAAAGAAAGAAVGSVVPVVGTAIGTALGGVLGAIGGEAFVDWLRGFLPKSDLDLYLDPTARLTQDFVEDSASAAEKQRLVLMLDTYEQMVGMDEWVRDLVKQLPANVLAVIAGREAPGKAWDRDWPGWMTHARIEALEAMTEEHMRTLVQRYFTTMRGGEPDPAQVEKIVRFARGLPLVVTSAVRLWVRYGVQDFQAVKPQVVADLVDRLMEGTPEKMRPALDAAAALRWFNKELLRVMLPEAQTEEVYDELRRFPFVRSRAEGLALHDMVREILDDSLEAHDPERHHALHEKASTYFETRIEQSTGDEQTQLMLERLYHRILANEKTGIQLFQETAEGLVRSRLLNPLRSLLNDMKTQRLEDKNSHLWWEYYSACLSHAEIRYNDAEKAYRAVAETERANPKLRAYALCDWGHLLARYERLSKPSGLERALSVLEHSLQLMPERDPKIVSVYAGLRGVYTFQAKGARAIELLERQLQLYQGNGDMYGVAYTLSILKVDYGTIGDWGKSYRAMDRGLDVLKSMPDNPWLRVRLRASSSWIHSWSGRYNEAERASREGLDFARRVGDRDIEEEFSKDLALTLGLQNKYQEALGCFTESCGFYENLGSDAIRGIGIFLGFWGSVLTKQGQLKKAEEYLKRSLSIKQEIQDSLGIPELLCRLGELNEVEALRTEKGHCAAVMNSAEDYYHQCLDWRWTGRRYFECAVFTGLVRVKHAQDDYVAIPSLMTEADQLAQQYEYNDHLASLRLTQGHIAWECSLPDWGIGFDAALAQYQQALIYVLRYNRFLLDEVLWGGGVCTPLDPIIPHCQKRGDEGRHMLQSLRDWWQTGINDVGTPRPDTISPIPEGIPLLEAERIAREREPGDGSRQRTVTEALDAALAEMS